jgi:hypothetical protein
MEFEALRPGKDTIMKNRHTQMKSRHTQNILAALGLALMAMSSTSTTAAEPIAAAKPNADKILREASAKLAAARQFSFQAHREMDAALLVGRDMAEDTRIEVTVQRPNKVFADGKSQEGERRVYADGKNFSLVDAKMNLYATVPMHTSLDGLVNKIDEKYGFTPPLAEFVLSNPYKEFHRQARTVTYLGPGSYKEGSPNAESVDCHRLLLSGHGVEAELWVGVNDHLIRQLVATFIDRPDNPQIRIEFADWNLAAQVTDGEFTYTPAPGAVQIPMKTTAEMASAPATTETK